MTLINSNEGSARNMHCYIKRLTAAQGVNLSFGLHTADNRLCGDFNNFICSAPSGSVQGVNLKKTTLNVRLSFSSLF